LYYIGNMPTTRSKLVKKLDQVFSKYIRTRNVDDSGYADCFTCGTTRHWSEVDAGHFMSRGCYMTRWDEQNVQFQCKRCNGFRSGEQYKFAIELDALYGDGTADELVIKSKQTARFSIDELKEMIRTYTERCDEIRRQKGV